MNLTEIEIKVDAIERVLDRADANLDQASVWFTYGFLADDVQRYVDLGIVDAHTAETLRRMGCKIGLIENIYTTVVKEYR